MFRQEGAQKMSGVARVLHEAVSGVARAATHCEAQVVAVAKLHAAHRPPPLEHRRRAAAPRSRAERAVLPLSTSTLY